MSSLRFKDYIRSLRPYEPGKPIDEVKRELGLDAVLKMASNENALGPSRRALKAMRSAIPSMFLYPEGGCFYLKNKLAQQLNVRAQQITFGNGSNEIIEFIVKGFLYEGGEILSSEYAFAVYPILTQAYGGKYVSVPMKDLTFDLKAIAGAITERTNIIFIANPNNPTGTMVGRADFEAFLKRVPKNVLVCLDEAYCEFVTREDYPNGLDYIGRENVVVLRTFSKLYGLAGLRIGYAVACEQIIEYFDRIRQPFNVNAMAQIAACAALDDAQHVRKTLAMVKKGKAGMYAGLEKLGVRYVPSETNFILIEVPDSDTMFRQLLGKGLIVRSMKSYGLDKYVRVTIGTAADNARFLTLLKSVLQ